MTDKDIVKSIRGTGNAARILGGLNIVFSGILYVLALLRGGYIPMPLHLTLLAGIVIGCVLFVVGRRVYLTPNHNQKDEIYKIVFLSFLMLIIGITNKTFPFFFLMLMIFGINTLWCLKKHGPVMSLPETLADLVKPTMTDAERKEQKKMINRNTWRTVGLAFGIASVFFVVFIDIVVLFSEKFETDMEPVPIYITDPDAA